MSSKPSVFILTRFCAASDRAVGCIQARVAIRRRGLRWQRAKNSRVYPSEATSGRLASRLACCKRVLRALWHASEHVTCSRPKAFLSTAVKVRRHSLHVMVRQLSPRIAVSLIQSPHSRLKIASVLELYSIDLRSPPLRCSPVRGDASRQAAYRNTTRTMARRGGAGCHVAPGRALQPWPYILFVVRRIPELRCGYLPGLLWRTLSRQCRDIRVVRGV
jgi:hypothetical protein